MRTVIQRVASASVSIGGTVKSAIGPGLLVLLGVGPDDTEEDVNYLGEYALKEIEHLVITLCSNLDPISGKSYGWHWSDFWLILRHPFCPSRCLWEVSRAMGLFWVTIAAILDHRTFWLGWTTYIIGRDI